MAANFLASSHQNVYVNNDPVLRNAAAASISVWAYATAYSATSANAVFVGRGVSRNSTRTIVALAAGTNGKIVLGCRAPDTGSFVVLTSASIQVPLNTWTHIVGAYNYVGNWVGLYVNGILTDSLTTASMGVNTSDTDSLGFMVGSNGLLPTPSEAWTGILDDVRVYNRLLSAEEAKTIWACRGKDCLLTGLRRRYIFREKSSGSTISTAVDHSAMQRNATPLNSPVYAESILTFRRYIDSEKL